MKQLEFQFTPQAPLEEVHEAPLKFQWLDDRTDFELLEMVGLKGITIKENEDIRDVLMRLSKESTRHGGLAKILEEISKRYGETRLKLKTAFQCSEDIYKHYRFKLADEKQEYFFVVHLDNKHGFMSEHLVSKGTLNKSLVHPREVFTNAIKEHAAALICIHNHPSGEPIASPQDIQVTRRLTEVGKLVGIPVIDHIIIGNHKYFSLADHSLL